MWPTLVWLASPWPPAEGPSDTGAEFLPPGPVILGPAPLQPLWSPPLHTLRTRAPSLLPRSFWGSPFLMIHDPTSSELNNNLGFGIALDLGLCSLHEFFFSCQVFDSQNSGDPSHLGPHRAG